MNPIPNSLSKQGRIHLKAAKVYGQNMKELENGKLNKERKGEVKGNKINWGVKESELMFKLM